MSPIALILAAGGGRRLGLGPKALLPWDDTVLVVRAARAAIAAGLRPVVTAGPGIEDIRRHLAEVAVPVRVIRVPDAATGLSASWRAGVGAIVEWEGATSASPVVVMLVDQPGVGSQVLARLVSHFDADRVVRAAWRGQPGHPVAMSVQNARGAAAESTGDEAARSWMRSHRHQIDHVECADLGEGTDIDTAEDLAHWAKRPRGL